MDFRVENIGNHVFNCYQKEKHGKKYGNNENEIHFESFQMNRL